MNTPMVSITDPQAGESTPCALRQRALQACSAGDHALALRCLQRAVELDPLDADLLADLASTELEIGDVASAWRHVRRALIVEPVHASARFTEAYLHAHTGDRRGAEALAEQLLGDGELEAGNPDLYRVVQDHLTLWRTERLAADGVSILDPARLSLRERFDVLVKYLYATARLGMLPRWANIEPVALYRRHIHVRTGGVEPGDEGRKGNLSDFTAQFDALIDTMARDGFRPDRPIPLSAEDGLPRNGAHRLAAALAVGCHVAVKAHPGAGGRWGDDWFARHGFSLEERNVLLRAWAAIKGEDAGVVVLWGPVETVWDEMESGIDAVLPVVSRRTVELPSQSFGELVHDVYSFDWGPCTGENIHRKVAFLRAHAPRVRVLFVERPADAGPTVFRDLKDHLRKRYAHLVPVDAYSTLHMTESAAEASHLIGMFASSTNLGWLRHRPALRPELAQRLAEMRTALASKGISSDDCCVVGSSVLDAFGLRAADDVDFTLRSHLRAAHFDQGVTHLSPTLDVVSANYARSFGRHPAIDDDRLIDDPSYHFRVRGVRFACPQVVLTRKQHQRREKDFRDAGLLGAWLERLQMEGSARR